MEGKALRVDLSPKAHDFEPVALEHGIELLDRSGTVEAAMRRWFGRLAAQPERASEFADFYVCDDHGRRRRVDVQELEPGDLSRNRSLQADFEAIKQKFKDATPSNPTEEVAKRVLQKQLTAAEAPDAHSRRSSNFFKYSDRDGWRLVWAWGYQRRDPEPLPTVVCGKCSGLFVKRGDGSSKCPLCNRDWVAAPPRRKRGIAAPLLLIGLPLLALAGAGIWFAANRVRPIDDPPPVPGPPFVAMPTDWTGPSGARVDLKVTMRESDDETRDVLPQTVTVIDDPRVVRLSPDGTSLLARAAGRTVVHFYYGDQSTTSTFVVKTSDPPEKLRIEPETPRLGVGTTTQLRVWGEYGDRETDLTAAADWLPAEGRTVYVEKGRVEGLTPGRGVVKVRYRTDPDSPFLEASVDVEVVEEKYESLKLALSTEGSAVQVGRTASVVATLLDAKGNERSAQGSSKLQLAVEPKNVARIENGSLVGATVGKGKLSATFDRLTATFDFEVTEEPADSRFEIKPSPLQLVVGEMTELEVVGADPSQIMTESSNPEVVDLTKGVHAIGRSIGTATIVAREGERTAEVPVEVVEGEIQSIFIRPERIVVPVDGNAEVLVFGRLADDREVQLTPHVMLLEEAPGGEFAIFDAETLTLRGVRPTGSTPQRLVLRYGEQRAEAIVEVDVAPMSVELVSSASETPVGQSVRLQVFSLNGDRRVEAPVDAVQWTLTPEDSEAFRLDPRSGIATAQGSPGDSVEIQAVYLGTESNRAKLVVGEPTKGTLALSSDRSLFVSGETGQLSARLISEGASAGQALAGVTFSSDRAETIVVDANTGDWQAVAPGEATITATHPDHGEAKVAWTVVAHDKASLALDPERPKLVVGGRLPLKLTLRAGEKSEEIPLIDSGVEVVPGDRQAVEWEAPTLIGRKIAEPFALSIKWGEKQVATQVQVVSQFDENGEIPGLRIDPAEFSLAPQQSRSLRIEQLVPGETDTWQEIDATPVAWKPQQGLTIENNGDGLRPTVSASADASGALTLSATYGKAEATARVTVGDADIPPGELVIEREPPGESIAVGKSQRYSVVVKQEGSSLPVADVDWMPAFENAYVTWNPPLLTAKAPGHRQTLSAKVGDRDITFETVTSLEPPSSGTPEPPADVAPTAVRLVSPQGKTVRTVVAARFDDFRVEADFDGVGTYDVTADAELTVDHDDETSPPVTASTGALIAERSGAATAFATYRGVRCAEGLRIEVAEDATDVTRLELTPASVVLAVGESAPLSIRGEAGLGEDKKSLGDLTSVPAVEWSSSDPSVVAIEGNRAVGVAVGSVNVTARLNGVESRCAITVSAGPPDGELTIDPSPLRLNLGESLELGARFKVRRGDVEVAEVSDVRISDPSIVEWSPSTQSLVGRQPGPARVSFTAEGRVASAEVIVGGPSEEAPNSISIEPASVGIIVGETRELRVYVRDGHGRRIDRTDAALFESSEVAIASVTANRITGLGDGVAEIRASLPGQSEPAVARIRVVDIPIDAFQMTPSTMTMEVGEIEDFDYTTAIEGVRRSLLDHPDLKFSIEGPQTPVLELIGRGEIRAVAVGQATLVTTFRELSARVQVDVVERRRNSDSDPVAAAMRISPGQMFVSSGETLPFAVWVRENGQSRPVSIADGLTFRTQDPSIADAGDGASIRGVNAGYTTLTARFGALSATATVHVGEVGVRMGGDGQRGTPPTVAPVDIRFRPETLTLLAGGPAVGFNMSYVYTDRIERLTYARMTFESDPPGIVEVAWTAAGPSIRGLAPGRARVFASDGSLRSRTAMLVQVNSTSPGGATLRPEPLDMSLSIGQTASLQNVRLLDGGAAATVAYDLSSSNGDTVRVNSDRTFTALRPGAANLRVTPVGVGDNYASLAATVRVTVWAEAPPVYREDGSGPRNASSASRSRLILRGPSQTTVGSNASYSAELIEPDGSRRDVTYDNTSFVLDLNQSPTAETLPGGVIRPIRPGVVTVRAQYRGVISNPLTLSIYPIPEDIQRLVLEMDRQAFNVDESRAYRVLGYTAAGGSSDLTAMATGEGTLPVRVIVETIESPKGDVARHQGGVITATGEGRFRVHAEYGRIASESLVFDASVPPDEPVTLSFDPPIETVAAGSMTPKLTIFATTRDGRRRQVNAVLTSSDPSVLQPDPYHPRQFRGVALGDATIVAAFNGQEVTLPLTVVGDRFSNVRVSEPDLGDGTFTVRITVAAVRSQQRTEYRIVDQASGATTPWKGAESDGNRITFSDRTPTLKLGPPTASYNVIIESRENGGEVDERVPCEFRLVVGVEGR